MHVALFLKRSCRTIIFIVLEKFLFCGNKRDPQLVGFADVTKLLIKRGGFKVVIENWKTVVVAHRFK